MQFKDTQEKNSLIHYSKTLYCYQMTSPSTSTTSGSPTRCIPLFKVDLIPGGRSNRKNRQSVFFTAVNPIDVQPDRRKVVYDLNKPRIAPYKQTWRSHHNTVFWCNLQLAQRQGFRFYRTRSHAIILFYTQPAFCIVYMKTGEDLYCKVHQSPKVTASRTHAEFASWTSGSS